MTYPRPFIAGNWKMHGTMAEAVALSLALKTQWDSASAVELAVLPPFVYLPCVKEVLMGSHIQLGAQTVSTEPKGAFTGQISASMLSDLGCQYVLVGHSERRTLLQESNETVALQFSAACQLGIKPILCVGESLSERQAGNTLKVIAEQLAPILALKDNLPGFLSCIIAYEPIWAIGTGEVASKAQIEEVHAFIRQEIGDKSVRILYGGSVKADNAAELFGLQNVDGALVGGASLIADQFIAIALEALQRV